MKNLIQNRKVLSALMLIVSGALFLLGKGEYGAEILTANAAVISISEADKATMNESEKKVIAAVEKLCGQVYDKTREGLMSKTEVDAFTKGLIDTLKNDEIKALKEDLAKLDEAAKQQGTSLAELSTKVQTGQTSGFKSIATVLEENEEELRKVYAQGSGNVQFMAMMNNKGELVMRRFDATTGKAAGPHATINDVGSGGNVTSVTQSIDAASLLRLGGGAPIISQYRNTPWVFDLVNTIQAGYELPFAIYYEEQPKDGTSSGVVEGATKPTVQYKYDLKTASYKKEAALIGFTEEFKLDFARLQDDIMNKGRVDVINRINTAILANITSASTAYNTGTEFKGGTGVDTPNDFDVLAAMAAQVDNATFGSMANSAVMSTFKKYRMGVEKDSNKGYLNRPSVLDNLAFIGNPGMGADEVLVGDFKAYNVILRGGFIIKVGYNGTDFAENRFSVVMEQFYYDYIAGVRKVAIVKGPDFATVKLAIAAS